MGASPSIRFRWCLMLARTERFSYSLDLSLEASARLSNPTQPLAFDDKHRT